MNHSVAIILSVYKAEKPAYLYQSLSSLFSQTMSADIYLYIDGEITVSLENVINDFKPCPNFYIIRGKDNKGLAFALNSLIDITLRKGYKYIARMDTDDISRLDRIEQQFRFMEKRTDVDVLGGYCHEFGSEYALELKKVPIDHNNLKKYSIIYCPFIHPTVMFRSSVFKDGIRYPLDTRYTEDIALWLCLLDKGYCFHNLPKVLLDYRINEDTFSRRRGFKKAVSEFSVRFNYMRSLRNFSIKNWCVLIVRFLFHMLPLPFIRYAYKKYR
ncbi:glycosyltransferase [Salmonella enterica]|uniref:Glycosyltransferase n=1 Tax=Salmonella enterica subsp. houtenae serovar 45:g,z51:- TaxID=1967611 RepID=A0A736VBB6_SALHO|nr:glycosyltransferase [Salmonella enterica]EBP3364981.1 glycosyltransferase [Salmonella enterica subsp. enterica]ECG1390883.1 glycosyltransferase [Salmonella enterica subsp. houtenae str. CFSAN000557]HAF0296732.1 glycosyltransferase [Salmonella enterica subsp. houtenae serovar 43:z4,z32:-]EAB6273235.1 glycosyltransferase [Salmonella enterica subsp. houtenae]EAN8734181.1 glycosyltransferase [Salmonella enterica]